MPAATTHVVTERASRYLQQLFKHFAHKVAVAYGPEAGAADFPFGRCTMEARDGALHLRCESETDMGLRRTRAVVEDHLVRFAWREKPVLEWTEDPAAPAASPETD